MKKLMLFTVVAMLSFSQGALANTGTVGKVGRDVATDLPSGDLNSNYAARERYNLTTGSGCPLAATAASGSFAEEPATQKTHTAEAVLKGQLAE